LFLNSTPNCPTPPTPLHTDIIDGTSLIVTQIFLSHGWGLSQAKVEDKLSWEESQVAFFLLHMHSVISNILSKMFGGNLE
jgi:hypothetical protein